MAPVMAQQQQSETELAGWLALFFPTVLTMIVRIGMGITDTAFVGHLAHDEAFPSATSVDFLSATSLALTWQGITSIICFNGGPPALSTLAGQAYGAGNLPLMGTWLHLSLIYSLVAALPVGVAWWYTGDVLRLALPRQACSDTCVQLAEAFSQRSLIWLYPTTAYFSFNTFLTCQKIVKPQMIISVAAAALNILLNYAFIYTLGWGYLGSPIATAATRWIYAFSLLVYIGANRERFEAMSVLSPDFAQVCSAARLKTFFAQAVPNQITAMLEQWQLQVGLFEKDTKEEVSPKIKAAVLLSMCMQELQGIIVQRTENVEEVSKVKEVIMNFIDNRRSSVSPTPMDIGICGEDWGWEDGCEQ